jgi:hypothetical protein
LSHERSDIAGAQGFHSLEGNMCGTAMRGAVALPGSKATSRATFPLYPPRADVGADIVEPPLRAQEATYDGLAVFDRLRYQS